MSTYRTARDARLSLIARRTRFGGSYPGGLGERVSDVVLRATLFGTERYRRKDGSDQKPVRLVKTHTVARVVRSKPTPIRPEPVQVDVSADLAARLVDAAHIVKTTDPATAGHDVFSVVADVLTILKPLAREGVGTPEQGFWAAQIAQLRPWLAAFNKARQRDSQTVLEARIAGLEQMTTTLATLDAWPADEHERVMQAARDLLGLVSALRHETDYEYSIAQRGLINAAVMVANPKVGARERLERNIAVTTDRIERARVEQAA